MRRIIFFVFFFTLSFHVQSASMKGIDLRSGANVDVKMDGHKTQVLYFLNSDCPCSQAHFDHLNELQKKYSQFQFFGFHSNKSVSQKKAQKYFSKFKIDFPILLDKDLAYANQYEAVKTPHVFVVDKSGKTLFQGAATNSRNPERAKNFYLRDALSALSQGKEPEVKVAKTIGCYIQR